ncbi:MAG: glycosyl transferase family 2 [Marinilabiliales bacterium]|nr:MAG: glycosyl transferase family 2 [Marinilabiliales bacterium]
MLQYLQLYKDQIVFVALLIFGFSIFVQLFYYLFFFIRIVFHKTGKDVVSHPIPVSVIICAKNEAENLQSFLENILKQNYPDFEVIVVNDNSTDNTENVLNNFKSLYPNLKVSNIKKEPILLQGKKLAQTVGIKAAKNELLLMTDADCKVESEHWIEHMVRNFNNSTDLVLGYGGFIKRKGLLDKLIRYDALFIAIQYLSFAKAGIPYMGVGRNLAYRKSLFLKNKGFAKHYRLASGDDDLFVNEVSTPNNTKIEISLESHTRTVQANSWTDWKRQKTRHLTTGSRYRFGHKILLVLEVLSRYLLYFSLPVALLDAYFFVGVLGALAFRLLLMIITIKLIMNRLNERDLLLYSLVFELLIPIIIVGLSVKNYIMSKRYRWR